MMRTLYLDAFSGVSGDMLLGLIVDLGVDLQALQNTLDLLPVSGYRIEADTEQRHGIAGTRVRVRCQGEQPHRSWQSIDRLLGESDLPAVLKDRARRVFRRLGEAEAKVHGCPLEQVHFHEVGAVDAIVDIIGTLAGFESLGLDQIVCSPLPLASGLTRGEHGPLPLPAPATLELLRGKPVRGDTVERELVTPTGAAIVSTIGSFGPLPEMTLHRIGYGVGGWQLEDRPNLLRGILGQDAGAEGMECDSVAVLETHLDDAPGEWLGTLFDTLFAAGALDVSYTPLQMKKNRPGVRVTVIAPPAATEAMSRLMLRETSAIGVRVHQSRRFKLRRRSASVTTAVGPIAVKLVYEGDRLLRITPEHADCAQRAAATGRPLPEIYRLAQAAAERMFDQE